MAASRTRHERGQNRTTSLTHIHIEIKSADCHTHRSILQITNQRVVPQITGASKKRSEQLQTRWESSYVVRNGKQSKIKRGTITAGNKNT
jgi:hypothetical protein